MKKLFWILWVTALIACRGKVSLSPSMKIAGSIDGPGTFELRVPDGYVADPSHSTGLVRRWIRGAADPLIELDATSNERFPTCTRLSSDIGVADELGTQKDTGLCRQAEGPFYLRRLTRGDDPLSCFVVYKGAEDPEGERVKAGIAICDSLRIDEHLLTANPHVLSPTESTHLRIDFPSGASGFVDLRIPARYLVTRGANGVFIRHRVSLSLPWIGLLSRRSVCDEGKTVSKIALEDGSEIAVCDFSAVDAVVVMRSIAVGNGEDVECFINVGTSDGTVARTELHKPLPPDVVEQRQKDAIEICKSVKVSGYQKLGNPTK